VKTTILNINNYHYRRGGADVMYLEQSRLFEKLGWQVVPFSMHHPKNEPSRWSRYFVDEIEFGFDYSPWQKAVRVARVIYSRQAQLQLCRLLDEVKIDIAHVHNVYHHISPSILGVLKSRAIPLVLTTHDLKLACPAYQMITHDGVCERCRGGKLRYVLMNKCLKGSISLSAVVYVESTVHRVFRSFTRNVDRFVSPSRFYIEKFGEWGFDSNSFVYIPNYIDLARFESSGGPGRAFVYFGRLAREKGLSTLLRAAAKASVSLWIIGTGPEERSLRHLADELGAEVGFFGYLTGRALHERVRAARASVLPSEWYENAPVSVLESYALGTPCIGARIGGITELIREGETGFSFKSGSVEELAEVLGKVAAMPDDKVRLLGRAGRQWVEDDFSSALYVKRLLNLYRELGVSR
jgi:glycosyltransferase involved in cell wall biosynthesis